VSAAVEAHGVRKRYGALVALDDLSFAVEAGEILGVLGPNGAGKTTAIRVLTTILAPTSGGFSVAGEPHTHQTEIRRRIGVLPESSGYPQQQTGEEYLGYYARLYGGSATGSRTLVRGLLEEVGLNDRRRSLIASYSRGMCQRLGIARALVNEPRVVFLDEPTLGLDPAGQRQILTLVRRLARERGATVLLCTHLLAEVEELCTRVLILNRGRVVADGTVAEIVSRAAAPRSARLRVAAENREQALRVIAGTHGIERVEPADGQPGSLAVTLAPTGGRSADESMRDALRALLDAEIPLDSFELEGARLSDAFLAMTGAQ
jgi:ABC-2 type transport system ATP-binding protein